MSSHKCHLEPEDVNDKFLKDRSQSTKKVIPVKCDVCGKAGHSMEVCFKVRNAVQRKALTVKGVKLFTADNMELQIKEGETYFLKYQDLFPTFARQRTQTSKQE